MKRLLKLIIALMFILSIQDSFNLHAMGKKRKLGDGYEGNKRPIKRSREASPSEIEQALDMIRAAKRLIALWEQANGIQDMSLKRALRFLVEPVEPISEADKVEFKMMLQYLDERAVDRLEKRLSLKKKTKNLEAMHAKLIIVKKSIIRMRRKVTFDDSLCQCVAI